MTPKYFSIKMNGNNIQNRNTRITATRYGINQDINFLYCTEQKLSELLYNCCTTCIEPK